MGGKVAIVVGGLAMAAVVVGGCRGTVGSAETGSGTVASEARTVGTFTALRVGTAVQAEVTLGGPVSVRVTADDNLLDNLRTDLSGSELDVHLVNADVRSPARVSITTPSLDRVRVDSAGRIVLDGLDVGNLIVRAESSGQVEASGRAATLTVDGASAGQVLLDGLAAGRATVHLDSAAIAKLRVAERVEGKVSAGAVLMLSGDPSVAVETESGGVVAPR